MNAIINFNFNEKYGRNSEVTNYKFCAVYMVNVCGVFCLDNRRRD